VPRHFISLADLTPGEIRDFLDLARLLKLHPAAFRETCRGRTLAMIFQKPSLRTRVSFEAGIFRMGGQAMYLGPKDIQLHRGESIADTARVLGQLVDGIMARMFDHNDIVELARHSPVPVINGLSDWNHPCQAIADLMTLEEKHGRLHGLKLAYIGDGNNMAHSLLHGCSRMGVSITVAHPPGYAPDARVVARSREFGEESGAVVTVTEDPHEAAADAHAVYTDVWTSMGQEEEEAARRQAFQGFQVDAALMARAKKRAIFLHCLPAHRGEEVSADVMDGPQSVVFDQAENRMHAQNAVMVRLIGDAR
jgi:ornithine carbamoyltransferase